MILIKIYRIQFILYINFNGFGIYTYRMSHKSWSFSRPGRWWNSWSESRWSFFHLAPHLLDELKKYIALLNLVFKSFWSLDLTPLRHCFWSYIKGITYTGRRPLCFFCHIQKFNIEHLLFIFVLFSCSKVLVPLDTVDNALWNQV